MTGDKITLGEARRRQQEINVEGMKEGLEIIEGVVRHVAETQNITVEEARTLIAPQIADQIATMNELHRLDLIDLEMLVEEDPDRLDK